ncbi:MFS transporter [Opitutales bacterium ASA1]|uniref:glycoside-pentoside-hexuronide (GPH):cation symporter n=1 Tax=Congregicoccus parvus TaxID=3081749 RepID=UPI002B302BE4|nr:MFS transporter [Opitutales bacterium ASA1]
MSGSRTSYTTRFSYAASDVAGQLVFCVVSFYLSWFYTDVFGISPAAAGTILLVARWVDAIDAPLWGILFDRTRSRWGKSRPWFLWLSLPFATFGVLTFLTPDIGYTAKVWYAAITYIGCSVLYTGINTPVTSILSALTSDPRERVTLTAFRMFGSKLGVLIVNLTALRLVALLGEGDDRRGFMLVMPIYAAGSVLLFLLAFRNLREVVRVEHKPQPILAGFGALRGNWPWMIIFASSLFFWIGFIARVSTVPYFFEYALQRKDLVWLANSLDFVSLATAFLLPWLCRWTSKRNAWAIGLAGMVFGQLVVGWGVSQGFSLSVIMTGWTIGFLASGMAMAMPFSLLADSVDYGEWKNGIRAAGLLTAIGAAFCLKAGAGLGGALPLWIMQGFGYVPNTAQTAGALDGIAIGFVWLPAACFFAALIPVLFYGRFEKWEPEIHAELDRRRANTGTKPE